jgi:hypothetical protein
MSSVPLVAGCLLVLLVLVFPAVSSADSRCSGSICDAELASAGCIVCASNSSLCSAAWGNSSGSFCGVASSSSGGRTGSYAACCPTSYPCSSPISWYETDSDGVRVDMTSYRCGASSADYYASSHSFNGWWWILLSFAGCLVFWFVLRLRRRWNAGAYPYHSGLYQGSELVQRPDAALLHPAPVVIAYQPPTFSSAPPLPSAPSDSELPSQYRSPYTWNDNNNIYRPLQ